MKFPFVLRKKHDEQIRNMGYRIEAAERAADDARDAERRYYDVRLRAAVDGLPEMQEEVNMLSRLSCNVSGQDLRMRGTIQFVISFCVSRQFILRTAGIDGAIEYIAKHCGSEVRRGMLDSKQLNVAGAIAEALKWPQ